jgi:MoaA/NifB/PqqE/SkfB family radical SAM enzyme
MLHIRENVWGGDLKKIHKVGNKYYINMYTPGWPSAAYDNFIKCEINRYATPLAKAQLSFVFLAITTKCPLRCEHCFEAANLNQQETFHKIELIKAVELLQKEGVLQFHFSGGEPLVRIKDLLEVIQFASKKSECWVATSGFNLTPDNALALKKSGCRGVIVSIDHYIPELHNKFRHHPESFSQAITGLRAAQQAGLVTAVSVCTTRQFLDDDNLMPYIQFASRLNVQFIQLLEPKDVGNYKDKDVLLLEKHIRQLEDIYLRINYMPAYKDYPTVHYHGYHQNRIGCFAGSRSIYIDSAGDVHACPFCHTRSYNILDVIRAGDSILPSKENVCPRYASVV